jgi:Domain of unknown function (DUF4158)
MTSIERTAYPRFGRVVTARELKGLSPFPDEIQWARERTRSHEHLLGLVVALKCFERLGYFPTSEQVPDVAVDHVRRCVGLPAGTMLEAGQRTAAWQRELVRGRVGAAFDPERARTLAAGAIRAAAEAKNHPPDLINVALELLVKESLELPGFWTLDRMASEIRLDVNTALFEQITGRMTELEARRINTLLKVTGGSRKSAYDRLKQAAGRASWSGFREQVKHLGWVDSLGEHTAGLRGSRSRRSPISRARRRPLTPR